MEKLQTIEIIFIGLSLFAIVYIGLQMIWDAPELERQKALEAQLGELDDAVHEAELLLSKVRSEK